MKCKNCNSELIEDPDGLFCDNPKCRIRYTDQTQKDIFQKTLKEVIENGK